MVTLSNCKVYLRIDTDFEDKLIEEFISAADLYLKSAITDYEKSRYINKSVSGRNVSEPRKPQRYEK